MIPLLLTQSAPELSEISYGWMFAKMMVAMIVIIALALVTIKYALPKMMRLRQNPNSRIKVLDYQPLEPRKSIYIVEIDKRRVAIGVTEHGIQPICELEDKA